MREEVLARLAEPYSEQERQDPDRVASRLGLELPNTREVTSAVFWDLDPQVHGIGWWEESVDEERRILIGDHLLQSLVAVSRNLIEAHIHFLEVEDYIEKESAHVNELLRSGIGTSHVFGAPHNALGEAANVISDTHIVGFLRAVGSTFDCLGTAAVAMLGIPSGLFRCDWNSFRKALQRGIEREQASPMRSMWKDFQVSTDKAKDEVGEEGWLDWTLETRNMLVHRPRRIGIRFLDFVGPPIFVTDREIRRARAIPLLTRDPRRSEMEVLVNTNELNSVALTESAVETLSKIEDSATKLVEHLAKELLSVWQQRKSTPTEFVQPGEAQWPEIRKDIQTPFAGYTPGSVNTASLDTIIQHPSDGHRMRAAGLLAT